MYLLSNKLLPGNRPARRYTRSLSLVASAITLAVAATAQPFFIDTVPVGNAGNAADPLNSGSVPGIGAVSYAYRIGKTEVTNAQYVTFLNIAARTDTFRLYNASMATSPMGGILQSGTSGSFSYIVRPGYANMPVTFVSFWDSARFANWMSTGYTEGRVSQNSPLLPGAAYDLNFSTSPTFGQGNRLAGARIFLPSENEWYKAAYHQPTAAGGDTDSYWRYATGSNTQPTSAAPGAGIDRANYYFDDGLNNGINGGYAVTQSGSYSSPNASQNYLTDVGVYGTGSESYYGTADQTGNVWEWNDTEVFRSYWTGNGYVGVSGRGFGGGSWRDIGVGSDDRYDYPPQYELDTLGFRVASLAPIPEPGTYAAVAGVVALACVAWRRRFGRGTAR